MKRVFSESIDLFVDACEKGFLIRRGELHVVIPFFQRILTGGQGNEHYVPSQQWPDDDIIYIRIIQSEISPWGFFAHRIPHTGDASRDAGRAIIKW